MAGLCRWVSNAMQREPVLELHRAVRGLGSALGLGLGSGLGLGLRLRLVFVNTIDDHGDRTRELGLG